MGADKSVAIEEDIYEAAVNPEMWPFALEKVANLSGSNGAVLFGVTERGANWTASEGVRQVMEKFVTDGWVARNSRASNGILKGLVQLPCFHTEEQFYDGDDYERDPLYTDFFRPNGLGWSAGTAIELPHGDFLTLRASGVHLNPYPASRK
jgi:hypothetical protein